MGATSLGSDGAYEKGHPFEEGVKDMLTFHFFSACGEMTETETLTAGMVGKEVRLEFSEDWEGFARTVVFTAGEARRIVTDPGEVVVIPHEVLAESRNHLYVGVYGAAADGRVMPSIRVQGPYIHPGVDPAGDESLEPTLPVWAQLQQQIEALQEEVPHGGGFVVTDDGTGNIVMCAAGNGAVTDDGAGNIAITMEGM